MQSDFVFVDKIQLRTIRICVRLIYVMEKIKNKLIQAGYKVTKPRLTVLQNLSNKHVPMSARSLHKKIKVFDRASIYRTLNLFEKLNLVNIEVINKEKIYCLADQPHHHIVCRKCGYMERVKCDHLFGDFKNFKDISHQFTVVGLCNKCHK